MRIAVIGAGAWGTTLASVLSPHVPLLLWAREAEVVASIEDHHCNDLYLAGQTLAPELRATGELAEALAGAEAVLVVVPAQHLRDVVVAARPHIAPSTPVLSLAKGIEEDSTLRMTQVLAEVLVDHDPRAIGVLSGPNIAAEVLSGQPAATVVALPDPGLARQLQLAMTVPPLRVYTNADVVGCEVGGAVKNVIALAAGMSLGMGHGENTIAALVTRGLAEMTRLGVALGADPLTFLGLAGIGDLMVTCHAAASRNNRVGRLLGEGRSLEEVLGPMHAVAEGVRSCGPVLSVAQRADVDLPICEQVGEVLAGRATVPQAVGALLERGATSELHDLTTQPRAGSAPPTTG